MTAALIQTWKFEPRPSVSPKATQAEWAWVVDWVREQNLQGKAYAVRTSDLEGEYVTVSFEVFSGQAAAVSREVRNL